MVYGGANAAEYAGSRRTRRNARAGLCQGADAQRTGILLSRNVFIDTMNFDPVLIRAAVDLLGADHVLAGSDWPIVSEGPIRRRAEQAFAAAALTAAEQTLIANGNAKRLLGI